MRVRLSPNSSSCSVKGVFVAADGLSYLKINVIAVPEKGKANQELVKFLGRLLRLPKSEIKLIGGETDRCKKLQLPFAAETAENCKVCRRRRKMTAQLINGKETALALREALAAELAQKGHRPHLAVVLAGDDEASLIYDRNKQKAAWAAGMDCDLHHLPGEATEAELLALVDRLNEDDGIHGVMVQLPLPKHIDGRRVIERICPEKDVDGFTPLNAGRLLLKDERAIVSATPAGICICLKRCRDLSGLHAVIIGRSNIVGKPLASLLLNNDCTVTVVHSKTRNLPEISRQADILIAACGCPKMVKKTG